MSPSTQPPQISAGPPANGDSRSFLLERCQQLFDARGQGPLSLAEVGKIVRQKPEMAGEYQTADGIRFAAIRTANVLEPLAAAQQWDLFEQIMGIDVESMAKDMASQAASSKNLEDRGSALRELSVN